MCSEIFHIMPVLNYLKDKKLPAPPFFFKAIYYVCLTSDLVVQFILNVVLFDMKIHLSLYLRNKYLDCCKLLLSSAIWLVEEISICTLFSKPHGIPIHILLEFLWKPMKL